VRKVEPIKSVIPPQSLVPKQPPKSLGLQVKVVVVPQDAVNKRKFENVQVHNNTSAQQEKEDDKQEIETKSVSPHLKRRSR